MAHNSQTDMGGLRERFLTTQWSLIENIKLGRDRDQILIGFLLEQYWKPVYCYLRRKGHDNEQAKDLTQAFFHEVVLNRGLVARSDQTRGRFRSFLLHALEQYVKKQYVKERAQKRIPREKLVSLDVAEPPALPESVVQGSIEESYHYAWLSALLERVIVAVRAECAESGMLTHWALFSERVVQPILMDKAPPSLASICAAHGITETQIASNMIVTVKRRFRRLLIRNIRQTLLEEVRTSEELEELLQFFPKGAQGLV
jgi:RNA polymerase sigma-70 factor (ECF subfamily)